MGLLNALQSDEALLGMHLLAAGAAKPVRTSFGEGLLGATQAVAQRKAQRAEMEAREEERRQRAAMQNMQMQAMMEAAAGRKKAAEQEQLDQNLLRQNFAPLPGPTPDGSPLMPNRLDPRLMIGQGASLGGVQQAMQLDQMLQPPKPKLTAYKPGDDVRDEQGRPVFSIPHAAEKPNKQPTSVEEFLYAQQNPQFMQYMKEMADRRTPKTSLQINTDNLGLKPKDRFEMEQKLAGDYTAATKLDRGIVTTAQDITNILKQGGALKDQAAIYKFAKALDPDGAVREADYAAIVQTAGGIGYVQALFNNALTGEQLLPRQRQEMINITQSMANVAQKRIENQRSSLSRNARQYNLTPENIFAPTETLSPTEGLGAVDLQAAAAAELKRRNGGR